MMKKMSGRSESEEEIKIDVKEEFHEISVCRTDLLPYYTQDLHSSLRCRLCAIQKNSMVDIFTIHETEGDIAAKIEYCLRVAVKKSDKLPKQVCWPCIRELELCYQFNKLVEEAEKQLLAVDNQIPRKVEETEMDFRPSTPCNAHCEATFDHNIEKTEIKYLTIAENEQSTGSTMEGGHIPASSEPCVGNLDPNENLCGDNPAEDRCRSSGDNECQKVDFSMVDSNAEKRWACDIVQQSTCDAKVSVTTHSRMEVEKIKAPSAHWERGSKDVRIKVNDQSHSHSTFPTSFSSETINLLLQETPAIPEESHTRKRRSSRHSAGIEPEVKTFITREDETCERTSIASSNLKRHPKKLRKKDHFCLVCGKFFKQLSKLNTHMIVHSSERSWKCNDCEKSYKTKRHLERHLTVCQSQIYNCNFCSTLFATKAALIRHMRLHTEERPYSCDYCGKKYMSKQSRDDHHRMHDGKRPFKCSLCAKTFSRAEYLQRHAPVHSDEKKFPCFHCDKSYKRAKARKFHIESVHINVKI